MKYKLSDRLNAFLNDNVLAKYKDDVEAELLHWREDFDGETVNLLIFSHKTTHGFAITVTVGQSDFVVVEPLKPYVWYESEKFDGNPEDYPLIESTGETYCCTYKLGSKSLYSTTKYFMYIEKVNK